ncbi:MAG: GTPase HflX [Planctomycetota bacterium]|nr:GTPase HflX [Planctomycetota bacterium]
METGRHAEVDIRAEPAILVGVRLRENETTFDDSLAELQALAETAGVRVVGTLEQRRVAPRGKTYIGKGKVEELSVMCKELGAKVVIFDNELAPSQIAELEKALELKVIDRSEVILDIFANRATTKQAQLQVEIAQLEYTAPRLRAMWSHLGQVTGGAPVGVGTRGPGEQQLEIDRRIVKAKLDKLRRELGEIEGRRSREVKQRRDEHFTAALVGYTNAGKSSIFNALTRGGAYAADKLFATLGTRVESWNLAGGNAAMLSDTVGFVQRLPHHLVASFRATLEDAIASHVILIVLDVADRSALMQYETVQSVLDEIGADQQPRILLLNKADRLPPTRIGPDPRLAEWMERVPGAMPMSALTGAGLPELSERVLALMKGDIRSCTLSVPLTDGRAVDFVEKRVPVLGRDWTDAHVQLKVEIGRRQLEQLLSSGVRMLVDGLPAHEGLRALWPDIKADVAPRVRPHDSYAVGPEVEDE